MCVWVIHTLHNGTDWLTYRTSRGGKMVRPVPDLGVWWAISLTCLSLLRLLSPIFSIGAEACRRVLRSRGFAVYQRFWADVGCYASTPINHWLSHNHHHIILASHLSHCGIVRLLATWVRTSDVRWQIDVCCQTHIRWGYDQHQSQMQGLSVCNSWILKSVNLC